MNPSPETNKPQGTGLSDSVGSWFSQEAMLLGEVRKAVHVRPPAPKIEGYSDLVELKSGGQGVVYSATQNSTHRRVAIKVLRAESEQSRLRFAREIDLAAGLKHPNIIRVYDSGSTADGRVYLVMELIEGPGLEAFAGDKTPKQIASLMAQVCEAVGYAHRRGVIHRDLKPDNIVIDGEAQARVLDFGLARIDHENISGQAINVTTSGQFVGSLAWASPEHTTGKPELIDTRSDVYSLGVTLYKLLTKSFPYDVTGGLKETLDRIATSEPVPPRTRNAQIDGDLQTIVLTCLAKEPDRRYGSAVELAADLRAYLAGEPIAAQRETAWRTLNRRTKRYRVSLLIGLVALGIVSGLLALAVSKSRAAERAKQDALTANDETKKALAEAQAARATAERREKQAASVAQFLTTMLRAADPNRLKKETGGRDVKVVDVLQRAAALIPEKFKDDDVIAASLHGVIGQTYRSLGQLNDAQTQLTQALERAEKTADESIIADASFNLGALIGNTRGKHTEALPLLQRAVNLRQKLKGDDDRATIEAKDALATQFAGLGRFDEARTLIKDSLDRRIRLLGRTHGDTITSLNNYGTFLRNQGKNEEALDYLKQAADAAGEAMGPDHPATLIALGNYGNTLVQLDRCNEAVPILERVVAKQRSINGDKHQHTIGAINQLAGALQWSKPHRRDEAVMLFRECIDSAEITLGKDHRNTITYHNNLAACLQEMGRYDEAVLELRAALDAMSALRGAEHFDTANIRGNLGKALTGAGTFDEAETMLLKAYADLKAAYDENHPSVRDFAKDLATLYQKMKKPDEAARWSELGK